MKNNDGFWMRVNALLDERADPLEDSMVQEHLLEHPQDMERLLSLQTNIHELKGVHKNRSLFRKKILITAASVLVLFLLFLFHPEKPDDACVVLDFNLEVTTRSEFEITSRKFTLNQWSLNTRKKFEPGPGCVNPVRLFQEKRGSF